MMNWTWLTELENHIRLWLDWPRPTNKVIRDRHELSRWAERMREVDDEQKGYGSHERETNTQGSQQHQAGLSRAAESGTASGSEVVGRTQSRRE